MNLVGKVKATIFPITRLLILLTILVVLIAIAAVMYLPSEKYSALGDLFSAVGSVLAVIWFSAGLFYQSKQLEEQREQFQAEFRHLREEAQRDALTFCKEILRDAEERALRLNPRIKSINDLPPLYLGFTELKTIMESTDGHQVRDAVKLWQEREGPAVTIMRGIKKAAEVYFTAIGKPDVDYSKKEDEFVYIYGAELWKLPYFDYYEGTSRLLGEFMIRLQPARKAAYLAATVAMLKTEPFPGAVKKDKIIEDVKEHRAANLPMPAIAMDL